MVKSMRDAIESSESAKRQYIDAESVFDELRRVRKQAGLTRGGMVWREINGARYLIRTSTRGAHKSLGRERPETLKIHADFTARKEEVAQRLATIEAKAQEMRRLNRALRVGRVPNVVVAVLNALEAAGVADHFTTIGTHALFAYESACGVRLAPEAMATRDIDLLLDTRKHIKFFSLMKRSEASLLGILKKADKTFVRLEDQKETVRNADGFEVDVIRRMARDGDPHPLRLSDDGDLWAVQASTGDRILGSPRFCQMVVAVNGEMAMMNTMHPLDFVKVKRALAVYPDREPLKRSKDRIQAELVEKLVDEYMPQYQRAKSATGEDDGQGEAAERPAAS